VRELLRWHFVLLEHRRQLRLHCRLRAQEEWRRNSGAGIRNSENTSPMEGHRILESREIHDKGAQL
jgi:hypothetical protein